MDKKTKEVLDAELETLEYKYKMRRALIITALTALGQIEIGMMSGQSGKKIFEARKALLSFTSENDRKKYNF